MNIALVLNALVSIPKIAGYVEQAVQAIVMWYVQTSTKETLSAISDVAAVAARAKTDEDRYASALAWKSALSRPRISAN